MARKNMFISESSQKRGRVDGQYGGPPSAFPGSPATQGGGAPYSGPPSTRPDNPPCNTLFIGGLGEGVSYPGQPVSTHV